MKDSTVEILLNTPLLIIDHRDKIREKPVLENVLRLGGKVIAENNSGLRLHVKWLGSEKVVDKNPSFQDVFIPYHKIDHVILG